MERAGFYKEEISLFDRDFLDIVGQRAVGYRLPELLAGYVLFKAEQKIGARLTVEDIPRLGLSRAAALFQAVGVVGVNLNREIRRGVDEFYQHREIRESGAVLAAELWMFEIDFAKSPPRKFAVCDC